MYHIKIQRFDFMTYCCGLSSLSQNHRIKEKSRILAIVFQIAPNSNQWMGANISSLTALPSYIPRLLHKNNLPCQKLGNFHKNL